MKCMSKLFLALVSVLAMLFLLINVGFAADCDNVNWEKSVITVKGIGISPQNVKSPAQARVLARRAAIVDGYRLLAESIKGVNVDAETTVENLIVRSDTVRTKVNACIQGAMVKSEKEIPEGYEVILQINMFGDNNPLAATVISRPSYQEPFPEPDESVVPTAVEALAEVDAPYPVIEQNNSSLTTAKTATALSVPDINSYSHMLQFAMDTTDKISDLSVETIPAKTGLASKLLEREKNNGNLFTGLIVDCRGLGLTCAMSPVIKNKKGIPIYGHKNLDYDLVISKGMVSYTSNIENVDRAGSRPLVVKAIELQNFNGNPVISVADANRVLIENQKAGFLDKMNVVFVR